MLMPKNVWRLAMSAQLIANTRYLIALGARGGSEHLLLRVHSQVEVCPMRQATTKLLGLLAHLMWRRILAHYLRQGTGTTLDHSGD